MEKLIELKNVAKVYKKHTVLENIHTTLYKGETVAIVGKNGAGKSTLVKTLAGPITYVSLEKQLWLRKGRTARQVIVASL